VAVTVLNAEPDVDLVDEVVFADVERLRPRLARGLSAGVAVAAAVGGSPVVPVQVQPPVANAAVDEPGEGESASLAVAGGARRPDLLRGDEVLLRDQRRMGSVRRQRGRSNLSWLA
jgi:hypothetical protein